MFNRWQTKLVGNVEMKLPDVYDLPRDMVQSTSPAAVITAPEGQVFLCMDTYTV